MLSFNGSLHLAVGDTKMIKVNEQKKYEACEKKLNFKEARHRGKRLALSDG